jgi:hypothetical protein
MQGNGLHLVVDVSLPDVRLRNDVASSLQELQGIICSIKQDFVSSVAIVVQVVVVGELKHQLRTLIGENTI